MKIILSLLFFVLYVGNSVAQSEVLSTNIYRKAMHVYENHMIHGSARNPIRYFRAVRGGGVNFELDGVHLERFMDLVHCYPIERTATFLF